MTLNNYIRRCINCWAYLLQYKKKLSNWQNKNLFPKKESLLLSFVKIQTNWQCSVPLFRTYKNKTKRLIDTIASNNSYRWKMAEWFSLTELLSYPKSRDAIASKSYIIPKPLNSFFLSILISVQITSTSMHVFYKNKNYIVVRNARLAIN